MTGNEYTPVGIPSNLPPAGREFAIPLNTLFTQVFGLAAPLIRKYKVPPEEKRTDTFYYEIGDTDAEPITEDNVSSSIGTPVNFWMAFAGGTYKKRIKGQIQDVELGGCYLPFASVATFRRAKRYTETYMSGQEGSVIEEYGFEPWDIRIQGFILKNDKALISGKSTVEEQLKELQTYENLSSSIRVTGKLFEWLNIHEIAFTEIDYPAAKNLNMEAIKPFEIKARSVQPIELLNI